ncbi:hypothetical protein BDF20DRAFT_917174 [Mycotypha africana]|uniref:uncharacterized protein n=1 Tax=Mycotypha africana TaxID=64632 RepID=UPI0022FFDEE1|nr:uncharacterized protein BDF20DRAFT_917174 [Mycotypha africana]KAI8967924.1 hypothetical protein BDF20DRAFT_917174 [Mycotypha africana]
MSDTSQVVATQGQTDSSSVISKSLYTKIKDNSVSPTNQQKKDDTEKKNKKHYKGRGRKKNANVLNATEAEASKSGSSPEGELQKDSGASADNMNKNKNKNKNRNRSRKPKELKDKNAATDEKNKKSNNDISSNKKSTSFSQLRKNRNQSRLTSASSDASVDTQLQQQAQLESHEINDTSTKQDEDPATNKQSKPNNRRRRNRTRNNKEGSHQILSGENDMATVLAHELKTSTYECMICMDVVRPAHHIWSCDCCWAIFHLDCVQNWAKKSLNDTSSNKMITGWRCPGCQTTRTVIAKDYMCFCGKQRNPHPSKYSTPHSCEQLCKRPRKCPHECISPCHPGPCAPCSLMGPTLTCYCGRSERKARCVDTDYTTKGFSCTQVCNELLGCGKHRCEKTCHEGLCPPCEVEEVQSCYCGRHERTVRCGTGKQIQLRGHVGYYNCSEKCDTPYVCGLHHCQKSCHPCLANSQVCPFDPTVISTCPCGKYSISELLNGKSREKCTDIIPTCESICDKIRPCGHRCEAKCHLGHCPPCQVEVEVPCRCQSSTFVDTCANVCEAAGGEPPICDRVCKSMRNCGRHQCGAKCCPAMKSKGKKKTGTDFIHDCPEICGRLLSCGNHYCKEKCHKGNCPPCLEAIFDEVTCHCGRTRLEPPVRCGTKLPPCPFPCLRPNPCGHIRFLNHNCHPDDEPCPPCPALVSRYCLCGKTELKNVPCFRDSPRCGRICDKTLPCGKHKCLKTCHSGPCLDEGEACTQICGGVRSRCGHACTEKCHDGPCPEVEPCKARIKTTCKCGQNCIELTCNATATSEGVKKELDCNDFCAKVQRNRRLALALGIKRDDYASSPSPSLSNTTVALSSDELGYYDDTLREYYLSNASWCHAIENTMIEFVKDNVKKSYYFKPMRKENRQFIHRYAIHFNLTTEAIDQEPQRSVILRKSSSPCRIPTILLSKAARNPSLACLPPSLQAESDLNARPSSKNPINALYLTDMAFGLTKIELDALLVPLLSLHNESIPFTSKWVNENDAVVVPSINDAISIDEKEKIIWQLKKIVKNAFVTNEPGSHNNKAARVDCCWVNQKGEVTWTEKQLLTPKNDVPSTGIANKVQSTNVFDALNSVKNNEDDGWMKVGGDNPYKPIRDAWSDEPTTTTKNTSTVVDASSDIATVTPAEDSISEPIKNIEERRSIPQVESKNTQVSTTNTLKSDNKSNETTADDWEDLLNDE